MDTTDAGGEATGQARRPRGPARTGLVGALIGVGAAAGGLLLLTGGAGAQPVSVDDTATTGATDAVVIEGDADVDAELEPYVVCLEETLAEAGFDVEGDGEADIELTEADWEAIEADVAACDSLIPEGAETELLEFGDAFADYEACLVDNGLVDEYDEDASDDEDGIEAIEAGAFAMVEDENGATTIEFGDGDGSFTLNKVDGEISIVTEGDVAVEALDWDDLEGDYDDEDWDLDDMDLEGWEECDDLLDDIDGLDDLDEDYGDFDDEEYEELEGDED